MTYCIECGEVWVLGVGHPGCDGILWPWSVGDFNRERWFFDKERKECKMLRRELIERCERDLTPKEAPARSFPNLPDPSETGCIVRSGE